MERQYAYLVQIPNKDTCTCIVYHLGKYCVVVLGQNKKGTAFRVLKQYKTLSGAENYLLRDYSYSERTAPEILYATKAFIEKGSYWR